MAIELSLREITEEDLPTLFHHQVDPDANRMAEFTPRSWNDFVNHWKTKILANPSSQNRAIIVRGNLAGYITSWNQIDQRLLAYWIGREYWGQGIATQSLLDFLHLMRERPLYAYVAKHNTGSIRVLEKCGFKMVDPGPSLSSNENRPVEEYLMELA